MKIYLQVKARADLKAIWHYSYTKWGIEKADLYLHDSAFIKKRDEARFNRVKKEYDKGDKTFYQAIGEIASDNKVIINSIENCLIGMLPDNYTKGITTSEIIRIAQRMDPTKYNGRQDDLFKKVYKRVDSAFNSFEKFSNHEQVSKAKRISHHGNRINDSLSLLMNSLEMEETHKESEKPFESLIDGLFRINSDQSVSSHAERITEQRRQVSPHINER
jgi:hypothetical protein